MNPEPKSKSMLQKAWNSKAFQGKLAQQNHPWIYDGRALAW